MTNSNLQEALRRPNWALITATKEAIGPGTHPENVARNARLFAFLLGIGATFKVGTGWYKGVDQGVTFMLVNYPAQLPIALCALLEQESFINASGLVYCDGSFVPSDHSKDVVGDEAKKCENYTVLEIPSSLKKGETTTICFSLGLDFSKKQAAPKI